MTGVLTSTGCAIGGLTSAHKGCRVAATEGALSAELT